MKLRTIQKNVQQGFTMVELMVALLLGIFLLSATMNVFVTTKQSYTAREEMARVQENAHFAFETMRRTINSTEAVAAASSTEMTVIFTGRSGLVDCLGRPAETVNATYSNRFYIASGQIFCEVIVTTPGATDTVISRPLIDHISTMVIEFGLDTTAPAGVVDSYSAASGYDATSADLERIFSARVTLTLVVNRNPATGAPLNTQNVTFTMAMLPRILRSVSL